MNNVNMAFFLTIISGFSTLFGMFPIYFKFKNEYRIICFSLAFAAGVMLSISIFDLIPEAFKMLCNYNCFLIFIILFLLVGLFCSYFIDCLLKKYDSNFLYKVGVISMLGLILHNIPEGIITFVTTSKDIKLGISLAVAISLHNIPEGLSIGVPIYYSTKSRGKAFCYTLIAAFSELFGALITYLFLGAFINNFILGLLFSFIAGIMIYISLGELLPSSFGYNLKFMTGCFFGLGVVFMIFNLFF